MYKIFALLITIVNLPAVALAVTYDCSGVSGSILTKDKQTEVNKSAYLKANEIPNLMVETSEKSALLTLGSQEAFLLENTLLSSASEAYFSIDLRSFGERYLFIHADKVPIRILYKIVNERDKKRTDYLFDCFRRI
jgi:hypothetical protein